MKKLGACALTLFVLSALSLPAAAKWERQYSCSGAKNNFFSVGAFDDSKAATGGQSAASGSDTPVLFATSDGTTWADGTYAKPQAMAAYPWIVNVPSTKTGYLAIISLVPNGAALDTASSPGAWDTVAGTLPGATGPMPTALHFADPQNGWLMGAASSANWLVHTADAGATWDALTVAYDQDVKYRGMYFINDTVGWIAGGDEGDDTATPPRAPGKGQIQYTTDGGKTWKKAFTTPKSYAFDTISFADCTNGWASGHDAAKAYLLHSTDGGKTWKDAVIPKHSNGSDLSTITAIRFFDASEGWAAANVVQGTPDSPQFAAAMLHTTDGGKTWKQDTTYNDAAKADTGAPCCMPDPAACKGFLGTMAGQAHGAYSMSWPTRDTGFVVGSNLVIMKYTADAPSTKGADRCSECGGGKCHGEPAGPDGGTDDAGPTDGQVVGPDGEVIDSGPPDVGPVDAGQTNIIANADMKLCFSKDAPAGAKTFETVVTFAERKITGDLDVYVFPGYSTVTLADARAVAQVDGTGTTTFLKIGVSAAYKINAFSMQLSDGTSFAKLQSTAPVGQLMEKDLLLSISGLKADLVTAEGKPAGSVEGEMKVPVLSGAFIGSIADKSLMELFNTIREPCPPDLPPDAGQVVAPDGAIIGADGEIIYPDAGGGSKPNVTADEPGGGCSCGVIDVGSTAGRMAALVAPFLAALGLLMFVGRGRKD